MSNDSAKNIFYLGVALGFMLALVASTFLLFDAGYFRRMVAGLPNSRLAFAFVVLTWIAAFPFAAFKLYQGIEMWRAVSWFKEGRTITGVERRLEVAVVIGIGATLAIIFFRGIV